MTDISAIVLFCDDFRQDVNGTFMLIGVVPDGMMVPAFPATLPKLAIFARLNVPTTFVPRRIQLRLTGPGIADASVGDFSSETIQTGIEHAQQNGAPFLGLMGVLVQSPLSISYEGHLTVKMIIDDQVTVIGDLHIKGFVSSETSPS